MNEDLPPDVEQRIADAPPETRELYRQVDFGMEVQAFIASRVGRYLIQRSELEAGDAIEKLKDVNPHDAQAIRALQNEIWRAESVQLWMADAIRSGIDAERQLHEQEHEG